MNQDRQNNLIMLLILILGAGGGYFFYITFGSSFESAIPAATTSRDGLGSFKNLKINFLESNVFDTFRTFGEYPVNPGSVGRKDLFAPF